VIVPGLVIYAGLSGFQFPVLRAVIMATVLYLSITCNRVADSLYSLGFAATILMLIFPDAVFEASFQMTVTATASILGLYQWCMGTRWWKLLQKSPGIFRIPLTTLFVTCGAMLGIAPLMLYYFQQLSPYSFISNLVAFVVITPLLPFTLIMELLSLALPWNLLYPIFTLNVWLGRKLIWVATLFPPLPLTFPRPHLSLVWIYYIMLLGGMVLFLHKRPFPTPPSL
jgi:competence protein ComEC